MAVKAAVDEGELGIYADNLEDMEPADLLAVFAWYERYHAFPALPSPGEIRAKVAELKQANLQRAAEDRRRADAERERQEREAAKANAMPLEEARKCIQDLKQRAEAAARSMGPEKGGMAYVPVDPEGQRKRVEFEARVIAEYGSMEAYREHQRQKIEQQRQQIAEGLR